MDKQKEEFLKELVGSFSTKEEFDELRNSFLKQGIEALLNAEMYVHLGHLKDIPRSNAHTDFANC